MKLAETASWITSARIGSSKKPGPITGADIVECEPAAKAAVGEPM